MRIVIFCLLMLEVLFAETVDTDKIKHTLITNMMHTYNEEPTDAESLQEMFSKGIFYGRLRFNSFGYRWKEELQTDTGIKLKADHAIAAVGGSMIYKTAYLHGFSLGAGLYVTGAAGTLAQNEAYLYKSGKGVFSRYDKLKEDTNSIFSLAQAYLEYKHERTHVKVGRQIFESFLTRSNDTKMIPNTFEGVTLVSKDIPKTVINAAYLTRQKLRDHSSFHHVFAYGYQKNLPLNQYSQYTQNDDTGMHVGLTLEKLEARGIKDRLVVIEGKNTSIDDLSLFANYTAVPDLLSSMMLQADYRFDVGGWIVKPGVRYMQQFDNGAGEIGGASRRTFTEGYSDPNSLDTWLLGARCDLALDNFQLRLAYTKVADKADIIAPWRGFPTAGFTRAMSQYNWYANTKSYMVQGIYNVESFEHIRIVGRFAYQDFDDEKLAVQADSKVLTMDVMKGFNGDSNIYLKLRYAHVIGEDDTPLPGFVDTYKPDPSYDELRLEINYLF